jgi:hypothetical protein
MEIEQSASRLQRSARWLPRPGLPEPLRIMELVASKVQAEHSAASCGNASLITTDGFLTLFASWQDCRLPTGQPPWRARRICRLA